MIIKFRFFPPSDTLISLAKSFPTHFLPGGKKEEEEASSSSTTATSAMNKSASDNELSRVNPGASRNSPGRASALLGSDAGGGSSRPSSSSSSGGAGSSAENDFWEILLRLDGSGTSSTPLRGSGSGSKGKQTAVKDTSGSGSSGTHSASITLSLSTGYSESPLGTLMEMLAHPVIKRTTQLTDRLLRLLSLVCITLTEEQPAATGGEQASSSGINATRNTVSIFIVARIQQYGAEYAIIQQ